MAVQQKYISLRGGFWRITAKKIECFGWENQKADVEISTTTETTYTTVYYKGKEYEKESSRTVDFKERADVLFTRDEDDFLNLRMIFIPELIFNVAFFFRRIAGFLFPFSLIAYLLATIAPLPGSFADIVVTVLSLVIGVWVSLEILEWLLAILSKLILKRY